MVDIVFSSTAQLAAAIPAKHVSVTEVPEAHVAQIERHNPALNAVVIMDAKRARQADKALARGKTYRFLPKPNPVALVLTNQMLREDLVVTSLPIRVQAVGCEILEEA